VGKKELEKRRPEGFRQHTREEGKGKETKNKKKGTPSDGTKKVGVFGSKKGKGGNQKKPKRQTWGNVKKTTNNESCVGVTFPNSQTTV